MDTLLSNNKCIVLSNYVYTIILSGLLLVLSATVLYCEDLETVTNMTDDIALTQTAENSIKPSTWYGVTPGKTSLTWLNDNLPQPFKKITLKEKTILFFPPGLPYDDEQIDITFGRTAKITCTHDGIVESVNIGSYFPKHRPYFHEIKDILKLDFTLISKTSSYSVNSSVYTAVNGYVWLIVSNIESESGKRQVLTTHYHDGKTKIDLPLPSTPYIR